MQMFTTKMDLWDADGGQVCPSSYSALIEAAIANAKNGDMFAPFHPPVLAALADEYVKGSAYWLAVTNRFKQANRRVPLNDLDHAMRTMVAKVIVEPEHTELNYSVILGAALASARNGNARAPFHGHVIEALIALWIREENDPYEVGRAFERANQHISWDELKAVLHHEVIMRMGTPRATDITSLASYNWDRPVGDSGESFVYWPPAQAPKPLTA